MSVYQRPLAVQKLLIGQRVQKRHQRALVLRAEMQPAVGMLGEVRVQRGAALHAAAVVRHDFLQRGETAVTRGKSVRVTCVSEESRQRLILDGAEQSALGTPFKDDRCAHTVEVY